MWDVGASVVTETIADQSLYFWEWYGKTTLVTPLIARRLREEGTATGACIFPVGSYCSPDVAVEVHKTH